MGLWVQKYGGTSVANADRIKSVAKRVAETRRQGVDLVVVVSAMGDTTDDLIELASAVTARPNHREMDMLLSTGERVSMALLSMALADLGVEAQSFTGSQTGIITDGSHRRARIRRILGDRIRAALTSGRVPIVAGFQGVSEEKEITTLGRGGSDTTAVALAAALGAEGCDIFTDVDGVSPLDPRVAQLRSSRKPWAWVPDDLMVEWAILGAGVLHPRCVELGKKWGVRIRVRNSLLPPGEGAQEKRNDMEFVRGTEVGPRVNQPKILEKLSVTGITADHSKVWVRVTLERPTVVPALWDKLHALGLVAVSASMKDSEVSFFVDREGAGDFEASLRTLSRDGFVKTFEVREDIVPVSMVGDCFSTESSGLGRAIQGLNDSGIEIRNWLGSSLSVTFVVERQRADDAVHALEKVFFDESSKGSSS
jgi:aspartate kinase